MEENVSGCFFSEHSVLKRNVYCNYYKFTITVGCWNVCFLFI